MPSPFWTKEWAMYLWRRVYGEYMRPNDGLPVEREGHAPERYRGQLYPETVPDM